MFTGPGDASPDKIEYFGTTNPLHIVLHGGKSDLVLTSGHPVAMTVTSLEVTKNGQPIYEFRATSFQLADLFRDASDNGVLDTLPAEIFKGNDNIPGSRGDDVLFGFAGNDGVAGGNGNDVIGGGLGNDFIGGGNGRDTLVFNTALDGHKNVDHIGAFRRVDDTIDLENSVFAKLKHEGEALQAKYFHVGKNAGDHNDYIVYDHDTGKLFYDRDGDGAHQKVLFAILDLVSGSHPRLDAEDLFVT